MNDSSPVNIVLSDLASEAIFALPSSGFIEAETADPLQALAPRSIAIPMSVDTIGLRVPESYTDSNTDDDSGNPITPRGSSASSSVNTLTDKEKIGRWTEHEHQVFLEGLEKHGKQWKLIANMIGTRTVVQVRTHAQKYFQRVERHVANTCSVAPPVSNKPSAKRKMSLPPSLPSRSFKKLKIPKKVARSSSLSALPPQKPTEELLPFHNLVSNASSVSTETENVWNSFSPASVIDTCELDSFCFPTATDGDFKTDNNTYDFKELGGQDPLEWLVDVEPSILPESSLPMFPDLSTQEIDACDHYSEGNFVSEDGTSQSSDSSLIHESALINIVDPSVTVQSLLLLPQSIEE